MTLTQAAAQASAAGCLRLQETQHAVVELFRRFLIGKMARIRQHDGLGHRGRTRATAVLSSARDNSILRAPEQKHGNRGDGGQRRLKLLHIRPPASGLLPGRTRRSARSSRLTAYPARVSGVIRDSSAYIRPSACCAAPRRVSTGRATASARRGCGKNASRRRRVGHKRMGGRDQHQAANERPRMRSGPDWRPAWRRPRHARCQPDQSGNGPASAESSANGRRQPRG